MDIKVVSSLLLYLSVLALCLIAAYRAKYTPRLSFWFIVIVLTLLAGLRHQSVGIDTTPYVDLLSPLREGFSWRQNNINEPGFLFLSYILVNISKGYTLMLTVFAFIINFFTVKRLFDLRNDISFPWAIFIFFMQYYFTTFNTMRQWIAMAILFYFSKHIGNGTKGMLKFIIAVCVATLCHKTAIIMIVLVPLFLLLRKSGTRWHQIIKATMLILAPVALAVLLIYMQSHYGNTYGNVSSEQDISVVAIFRLAFFVLLILLSALGIDHSESYGGAVSNDAGLIRIKDKERFETAITVLGATFTLLVFFFTYADRLATYFMMFEMIVLPRYIKKSRFRMMVIVFVLVLFTYLRMMSFKVSGFGEVPYLFFWE